MGNKIGQLNTNGILNMPKTGMMDMPKGNMFQWDASKAVQNPATQQVMADAGMTTLAGQNSVQGAVDNVSGSGGGPAAATGLATSAVKDMSGKFGNIVSADIGDFQNRVAQRQIDNAQTQQSLQSTPGSSMYPFVNQDMLIRPDEELYMGDIPSIDRRTRVMNFMEKYNTRTAEMAAAGSAAGPWGTLIGGIVGSIVGGVEGIVGSKRMKKMNAQAVADSLKQWNARIKQWNDQRNIARGDIKETRTRKENVAAKQKTNEALMQDFGANQNARKTQTAGMGAIEDKRLNYIGKKTQSGVAPMMGV